jgi:transposase
VQINGIIGLVTPSSNQSYTSQFKDRVVQEYLSGAGSELDLAVKYGICSRRTVSSWIKQYNSHEDTLKSYLGGRIHMTKGRKTTLAERIEIVEYCIENDLDYTKTAEQFRVSYTQVYSWVKKYNGRGVSALKDSRGKGKSLEDMNEMERLQAENKLLEAKNKHLQMENDVLKKLEELERGRSSVFTGKKRNI